MSKAKKKHVSFNENYQKLKKISEELHSQKEPDIDSMVEMVKEASEAYTQCKQRLDDVQKAIEKYLPKDALMDKDID
jgi:exodeoxyribonuclease VII small subunit